MAETVSERLASFVHQLQYEELPTVVLEKAKTCLIHGIGVGLAGHNTDFPKIAAEVVHAQGSASKEATLLYDGSKDSVMDAAFANAVLFHSRVQEDTHNTAHLGTVVIPVILALGESKGSSGKELLTALIAGYEVGGALSKHFTSRTTPRGFRASSLYGIVGAAASAAKLLGLNEQQTSHALGFAASFAFGTLEAFTSGTMEWRFENGAAAKNGILCALMAKQGAVAARSAFEGNAGFLQVFAGDNSNPLICVENLGQQYEILNVTFKLYPVCAFNQSPVVNTAKMRAEFSLPVDQIKSIVIEMNDYEANYPGMSFKGPFLNISQTLMSAPFCVACCLLDGELTLENLQRYDHKPLNQLLDKTVMIPQTHINPLCNQITIKRYDGQTFSREMSVTLDFYKFDTAVDIQLIQGLVKEMKLTVEQLDKLIDDLLHLDEKENLYSVIPQIAN